MVIMNDLEWPMLSYYVIKCETFRKVMQWTEKVPLSLALLPALTASFAPLCTYMYVKSVGSIPSRGLSHVTDNLHIFGWGRHCGGISSAWVSILVQVKDPTFVG